MTGNCSIAIMRRADTAQKGWLEESDLVQLYNEDQVSYRLIEDLAGLAPDFMETHRQVLNGQGQGRGSTAASFGGSSKLR